MRNTTAHTHAQHGLLVACSFVMVSLQAGAQSWCPSGARWTYDTSDPWNSSQELIRYVGDTLVAGESSQRLSVQRCVTSILGNDTLFLSPRPDMVTRFDGDVMFAWSDYFQSWDTVYWFSALPGDSWLPAWSVEQSCFPENGRYAVLDTGSQVTQGVQLRTLTLLEVSGTDTFGYMNIIERIGTTSGYIIPQCHPSDECYCAFTCYSDDELSFPVAGVSCELPTGLAPTDRHMTSVEAFPNPGTNRFSITIPASGSATLRVYDPYGRNVHFQHGPGPMITVNASAWCAGVYHVLVRDQHGEVRALKWVKE